jgi:hypothetical protein
VGDRGPGGGLVFYVHPGGGTFASPGSDCGSSCRYLEAALSDLSSPIAWCDSSNRLNVVETIIGRGMANTTTADGTCTSGAIQIAADYANNGKSDWHLPSMDELRELHKHRMTVGGFGVKIYWSSSEYQTSNPWAIWFPSGHESSVNRKSNQLMVRLVRAF